MLIYLIFIGFGCTDDVQSGFAFTVDSVSFDAYQNMPVNPSNIQYIETDSAQYLFAYNPFVRDLFLLNFPSGNPIHRIHLEKEGVHGISSFNGGTFTGNDSIWYLSNPPEVGLLNFRGEILESKRVEDDLIPLTYLSAPSDKMLYRKGNKIFATQPLFMNHHQMNKEDIQKQRLIFSYNMINDSIQWYDVHYPENYWDKGKKTSGISWSERNGKLYIAPWFDHEIMIFDIDREEIIDTKTVKSNHVEKFMYANDTPGGADEGFLLTFSHEQYSTFLYDKYRDVFYRFFLPSFSPEELGEFNYRDLLISRPYLGVMVLDKDLNVIGEHIFDKFHIYTSSNHFVGKEGLYLSLNNLFDPDYDEEKFRYLIFKPEVNH